ncbi:hypothetical protein BU24DRAFT_198277 [Aaosphaeria arxii CBS 175.79]|uniref:Uncharacterized protein n=1 Tax=Aaosphaeria arxii CBS 175.79 TaxID=1450172 RepID=A0A6A5XSX1_9PLEO|nr:uncharacterized protein BU24DRAFT_198277 [Aaosphaeria arxii CBS 175.79]KAF2016292.1 hypothetical protein BU24DRAFT_198277 [Aaosphaeria arxii CBS 175.79]
MAGEKKYQPLTLSPINFSLTEGTSIPAPPDSPPDTPRPPTPGKGPLSSHPTPKSSTFPQNGETPPLRDADDSASDPKLDKSVTNDDDHSMLSPSSPTGRRPNSVRKFLGFRPMSSSDSLRSDRPGSPSTIASQPSLQRKKSGSWFGRRKSTFGMGQLTEGKENITQPTNGQHTIAKPAPPPQKKGPPPPALPELKAFGASDDAFTFEADDMFKNIK